MFKNISFLFFILLLFSCASNSKVDTELLDKAHQFYTQAAKIGTELKPQIESLIQQKNSLNIQGRALTDDEISLVANIESLEKAYQDWKVNHPEIPGYEEGHQHGDGCSHGKGAQLEIMPEDWVKVQQEFLESILAMQQKIEELN